MKTKLIRVLLWLSLIDFALGLLLLGYQLNAGESANVWRGALILLVVGAFGMMWYRSASRRFADEARA